MTTQPETLTPERRQQLGRSLTSLACMRRSGETPATLRKRDAEIARIEALLTDEAQA